MHFVVSWDIHATPPRWDEINEQMVRIVNNYTNTKVLTTLYVVQVQTQNQWQWVVNQLQQIAQRAQQNSIDRVFFLISPLINGGQYNGFLPNELWEQLNRRVQ